MPAAQDRIVQRPLSGPELAQIIQNDVAKVLARDGMFNNNIAYQRVSYEVRVSVHIDNPSYPEHVVTVTSQAASKQQVAANSALGAMEVPPLANEGEDGTVVSTEVHREIASPNMARLENDMPIKQDVKDPATGAVTQRDRQYSGDLPDPETVGNRSSERDTGVEQRERWPKGRRR